MDLVNQHQTFVSIVADFLTKLIYERMNEWWQSVNKWFNELIFRAKVCLMSEWVIIQSSTY